MFSEFINFNVESVSGVVLLVAFTLFLFLAVCRIAPQVYKALISTKAQDLKTLRQAVNEERELFRIEISEVIAAFERQAEAQRESCEENRRSWEREMQAQREMFKEICIDRNKP